MPDTLPKVVSTGMFQKSMSACDLANNFVAIKLTISIINCSINLPITANKPFSGSFSQQDIVLEVPVAAEIDSLAFCLEEIGLGKLQKKFIPNIIINLFPTPL